MPTLLALPDARRTPITRGEGRLGRNDYLVNWAGGGSCHARLVPNALATRVIALSVVWSLTRPGGQAQAMQAAATSAVAPLARAEHFF